jgi:hypothetical protein
MGQRIVPPGSSVSFIGDAVSGSGLTFQWLRGSTPLTDDAHLTGSTTATLTITNLSAADTGNYLFRALNGCGSSQTFVGGITVRCPADVTGPTPGTPDGGVTLDDLLYYIDLFTQGVAGADVDDGSRTGTLDRGVTIEDLLWYLARYDIGC